MSAKAARDKNVHESSFTDDFLCRPEEDEHVEAPWVAGEEYFGGGRSTTSGVWERRRRERSERPEALFEEELVQERATCSTAKAYIRGPE